MAPRNAAHRRRQISVGCNAKFLTRGPPQAARGRRWGHVPKAQGLKRLRATQKAPEGSERQINGQVDFMHIIVRFLTLCVRRRSKHFYANVAAKLFSSSGVMPLDPTGGLPPSRLLVRPSILTENRCPCERLCSVTRECTHGVINPLYHCRQCWTETVCVRTWNKRQLQLFLAKYHA